MWIITFGKILFSVVSLYSMFFVVEKIYDIFYPSWIFIPNSYIALGIIIIINFYIWDLFNGCIK